MARAAKVTQLRPRSIQRSEASERLYEEANPREVAKACQDMSAEMLRCRRRRQHKWEAATAARTRQGFSELLVCDRCKTEKDVTYNRKGHVVDVSAPRYPEGYLFKGLGRMGVEARDAINLASLQADMEDSS